MWTSVCRTSTPHVADVLGQWYSAVGGFIGGGRLWSRSDREGRGCGGKSEKWWLEVERLDHQAALPDLVRCKDWAGVNDPCQSQRDARGIWKGRDPRPPSEASAVPH